MSVPVTEAEYHADGPDFACPACHRVIATVTFALMSAGESGFGAFGWTPSRITLAPGFVNARTRHPSGAAWYVRGMPDRPARTLRVHVPAVVTCSCGATSRLVDPGLDETTLRLDRAGWP